MKSLLNNSSHGSETHKWEMLNLATKHRDSWRVPYYLFHSTPPQMKQHTIRINCLTYLIRTYYPQHQGAKVYKLTARIRQLGKIIWL